MPLLSLVQIPRPPLPIVRRPPRWRSAVVASAGDRVQRVTGLCDSPWDMPVVGRVSAPEAVLLRPEGYVAWVGSPNDGSLSDALTFRLGSLPEWDAVAGTACFPGVVISPDAPSGGAPAFPGEADEAVPFRPLGYRLRKTAWRQGMATEGAGVLVAWGLDRAEYTRITAQTMSVNRSSRWVMEKIGRRY